MKAETGDYVMYKEKQFSFEIPYMIQKDIEGLLEYLNEPHKNISDGIKKILNRYLEDSKIRQPQKTL